MKTNNLVAVLLVTLASDISAIGRLPTALAAPSGGSSLSSSMSLTRTSTTSTSIRGRSSGGGSALSKGVLKTAPFDASINVPSADLADEADAPLGLAFKPPGQQSPALQSMLQRLNAALEEKHKEQAKQIIQDYRVHHPNDQGFFGNVALHYSTHHDYVNALEYVSQGLVHYPQSMPLMMLKAQILLTAGDTIKAEKQLEICSAIKPQSEMLHAELARLYLMHHKLVEALKETDKAITIDSSKISSWQIKGQLLLDLHHNKEALTALDKAVQLTRAPADTYDLRKVRGPLLESLGHYDAAIKDYQYLLKIHPEMRFKAATHIGDCYLKLNHPKEALPYFDQDLKKKPNYLHAHRSRLAAYKALGDTQAATQEETIISGLHEDWEEDK